MHSSEYPTRNQPLVCSTRHWPVSRGKGGRSYLIITGGGTGAGAGGAGGAGGRPAGAAAAVPGGADRHPPGAVRGARGAEGEDVPAEPDPGPPGPRNLEPPPRRDGLPPGVFQPSRAAC